MTAPCAFQFFAATFLGLVVASAGLASAELRIVGTDLLGTEFSAQLQRHAAAERVQISLAFEGSRPGLDDLRRGRAQLALVTLPASEEAAIVDCQSVLLGWHRVVVLIPDAAPLERITLTQLAAIFGKDVPGAVHRWGDLGLKGQWEMRPLVAQAPERGIGLTTEYFRHAVLEGRALEAGVRRYRTAAELAECFTGEIRAMVLAVAPPEPGVGAKILPVAADAKSPAFAPTIVNLESGDYPLRLVVRAVFRREAFAAVLPMLRVLLSNDSAAQFARVGLAPAAPDARVRQLANLEKVEP